MKINEIDNEMADETTEAEKKKYLKRKADLEEETETAERKIRRYEARSRIVNAAKMRKAPTLLNTMPASNRIWN